jgi:hypothetical protein
MSQRTSQENPVSAGLARTVGQMVEAAALKYNGGTAKLELVKGDPEFISELYKLFDARSAKRAELLAFTKRPPWMTIRCGTHKSVKDLCTAVTNEGHRINDYALSVTKNKKFAVATEECDIELFTATVAELGFPDGARVDAIYARLDELGFGKCPDETALQLRRAYANQPMNEWRIVISEPLTDSYGSLKVLYVYRHYFGSWVDSIYAYPGSAWSGGLRLVFRRK